MPGYVLHSGATVQCPHQAPAQLSPSLGGVRLSAGAVAVMNDHYAIAACPYMQGNVKSPCVTIQWIQAATRVRAKGQPLLLVDSAGMCENPGQAPQGAPIVSVSQTRVKAT